MARWIVFTDNVFWKYSWAHVVISITVAFLYVMQCRLRARRSQASSMVFRPWPLHTEIVPDSLNHLWMILCTVDDDNFKLLTIFLWETPFWYVCVCVCVCVFVCLCVCVCVCVCYLWLIWISNLLFVVMKSLIGWVALVLILLCWKTFLKCIHCRNFCTIMIA